VCLLLVAECRYRRWKCLGQVHHDVEDHLVEEFVAGRWSGLGARTFASGVLNPGHCSKVGHPLLGQFSVSIKVLRSSARPAWVRPWSRRSGDVGPVPAIVGRARLNQATAATNLCRWLDGDTLRHLWPDLWLPVRLRALWQARFPDLAAPQRALAG
jgi:hypothetical protein